ncbi:pantothenate kinase 2 [Klebsormidium nitens]|uniref:pantothenate kinase n=1 Tax=Klebsormidium nitens TaxID=105231 RepID=A0A1Y1IDF4_KLENI|nr:pantothenate kinase 2 [Klebsormidium nitens]|eukprot:GAQ88623.1 pantothenate kinase 2 [Klebsormidium nitens]
MSRPSPRPVLNLSGAAIHGPEEEKHPSILLPNQQQDVSHFAIDIGGSLIKLVYFSKHPDSTPPLDRSKGQTRPPTPPQAPDALQERASSHEGAGTSKAAVSSPRLSSWPSLRAALRKGGRLHFVKFETAKLSECLEFIEQKKLHYYNAMGLEGQEDTVWGYGAAKDVTIKATGGGAFKYADVFKERMGITLEKEDEMECLVAGANFLLKAVRDEAYTHMDGRKQFVHFSQPSDLFPYLLVNIGSGVSMIKVNEDSSFERVSGTNLGGGTFWGLGRLLTKCSSFDEILEMTRRGDNSAVDMLVGDIYGGMDYSKIGLSASTIASSFGKVVSQDKGLEDYRPEDIALSLVRMVSYNIGQISVLNAMRYGLKRIFFGGFFIRGHDITMDIIAFAINFWSKGAMRAMFLRHEGFLGALGAFLSYNDEAGPLLQGSTSSQFVERFPMGAPFAGGEVHGPPIKDLNEKITWMEKFVRTGSGITAPTPTSQPPPDLARTASGPSLHVGVLHLYPSLEPFPLLDERQASYEPNTFDMADPEEREYWLRILEAHIPGVVEKAVASEGSTDDAQRRGHAFALAFQAHLAKLRAEPAAYGQLGLANLLDMREDCLREFSFRDAYRTVKERENEASLAVLPDLLAELDAMTPDLRLTALVEGVLAGNIFDWGSAACVELYQSGTILDIYRMSRNKLKRPWKVDDFDALKQRFLGDGTGPPPRPHARALLFVDNSGADAVLGMIPLARELLRRGTAVAMVANSQPAINDITQPELEHVLDAAAQHDELLRSALEAGAEARRAAGNAASGSEGGSGPARLWVVGNGHGSPCIDFRRVSAELAAAAEGADLLVLEGMGRALHTNFNTRFKCEVVKLAMIKNQRLAERLVGGNIFDCVCRYEVPPASP